MAAVSALVRLTAMSVLLGGCALVDQTTFNPEAGKPPVVAVRPAPVPTPPVPEGPPPLLTVRFGAATPFEGGRGESELREAVAAARARKRDVVFDVVAMAPTDGTPEQQAAQADAGTGGAGRVAAAIVRDGVPQGRVRIGARTEPGAQAGEVRVYVR